MPTIAQNLDDLDRMVDGGAAKHEVRGQIALINGQVAILEASYARLAQAHSLLQQKTAAVENELATLKGKAFEPPNDLGPYGG